MTATEEYIGGLTRLKPGDLGLLRTHAGKGIDESVHGFDLFAGLWWPLRQRNQYAPRRQVAWLIAKLYAYKPMPQSPNDTLAIQLGRSQPGEGRERARQKFDELLTLPLGEIEPALQWALDVLASHDRKLDWVQLTDDLSLWEREATRLRWAEQFIATEERNESC